MELFGALVGVAILFGQANEAAVTLRPPIAELEAVLDAAFEDDGPVDLVEGSDFTSPPGTVIFVSRDEGKRRLIQLARDGEPELGMLYVPEWGAWITHTTLRLPDKFEFDILYAYAAYGADLHPELWHFHNNIGEVVSPEEERKRSLGWTMPSLDDLHQVYYFERDMPFSRFQGVIAHIYGTTEYRRVAALDEQWAQAKYPLNALIVEAEKLHDEAREASLEELPAYAAGHKGFIKLTFERVP